ncbi:MAG: hypothetical protein ACRDMJ_19990 [Solirubrobacteraceae bacterium]
MVGSPRQPPRHRAVRGRSAAAGVVTLLALTGVGGARAVAQGRRVRSTRSAAVRFGIYPGGGAGTIGPGATPLPANPSKRLAALEQLADGRPFVLHLYVDYTGPDGASAAEQIGPQLAGYEHAGFQVELVLCYRPADGGSPHDVAGFARFARDAVASPADDPRVVSLQVTNEANVSGAANATDGYYRSARDALIAGVIAAKHEANHLADHRLEVGFNWAYETGGGEASFWRYLHRHGGDAFARAVDWVGLDVYPGTWGQPIDPGDLGRGTTAMMDASLHGLRFHYMPLAGLGRRVAIHVSENGYPTGPGRTPAMQATVMRASIEAVHALSPRYHITDYRWFDLRDADSASPHFEDRYGLMYDDYTPKLAFWLYRELIMRYGAR